MNTQNNPTAQDSPSSREIDLLDIIRLIFRGIGKAAASLWNALVFCVIYLIRKSLWLALFVVLGVLVALVPALKAPKFFASSAIVSSNSLESSLIVDNLCKINRLLEQRNYAAAASTLGISEAEAAQLKAIEGHYGVALSRSEDGALPAYYVLRHDRRDTSLRISRNFFRVKVLVYNEDIYPALTSALLGYIGSSEFGKQSTELRTEQIKGQLENLNKDIAAMQQAIVAHSSENQNNANLPTAKTQKSELVQLQEMLSDLYAKKAELERQSALFTSAATFVEGFSRSYTPANRVRYYAAMAGAIAFVLGLIGLIVWDNRKKIVAAVRDYK